MKLLLCLSFDGAAFCGYQAQANGPSVQTALNRAAEDLFGFPCDVTGCSRTDSGVHAEMFCASVTRRGVPDLQTAIPVEAIPRALNARLPDAVSVFGAAWMPPDFHPRYAALSKEYRYRFLFSPARDPLENGRSFRLPYPLTESRLLAMRSAAGGFVGRRDFSACRAAGSSAGDPVRRVSESTVWPEGPVVTFRVRADGFLYHMVRIMAGTLAEAAAGRLDPDSVPARLDSLDRRMMGPTAPAHGLYLHRVTYPFPVPLPYGAPWEGGGADVP